MSRIFKKNVKGFGVGFVEFKSFTLNTISALYQTAKPLNIHPQQNRGIKTFSVCVNIIIFFVFIFAPSTLNFRKRQ